MCLPSLRQRWVRRKGTDAFPSKPADIQITSTMSLRIANSVPDFPSFRSGRRKGKHGKKKIRGQNGGLNRLRICMGIRRAAGNFYLAEVMVSTRIQQAAANRHFKSNTAQIRDDFLPNGPHWDQDYRLMTNTTTKPTWIILTSQKLKILWRLQGILLWVGEERSFGSPKMGMLNRLNMDSTFPSVPEY